MRSINCTVNVVYHFICQRVLPVQFIFQGKFIRINFDTSGYIAGANIETCILFYFLIVWSVKYHRCRVSCVKRRCVFFVYVKKSQHRCQCLFMFHASLRHCKAFVAHYDIFEIKYEQSLRIWKSTVMSLICFSGIFFENFISSLFFSCPPTHTHCLNGARVYFYNLHSALLLCSKAFDFIFFFCAKLLSKVLDFRNHFLP